MGTVDVDNTKEVTTDDTSEVLAPVIENVEKEEEEGVPKTARTEEASTNDDNDNEIENDNDDMEKENFKEETTLENEEENDQDDPESKEESKEEEDTKETTTSNKDDEEQPSSEQPSKRAAAAPLPSRPVKRARTAYFIFSEERRPQVQAQHVGQGVAVVAKALGQLWGALSAEEKQVYQEKAAKERERVSKEMEAWIAAGGQLPEVTSNGKTDPLAMDFPVARIRKICKLDPEVRGLSKEALLLVTKCAELSLEKLGKESVRVAQLQNRRKLLPDDVAHVCAHREQFLFLKDDVKDLLRSIEAMNEEKGGGSSSIKVDDARQKAAAGSKPLTAYFKKE